jgi:hypothetical protein
MNIKSKTAYKSSSGEGKSSSSSSLKSSESPKFEFLNLFSK